MSFAENFLRGLEMGRQKKRQEDDDLRDDEERKLRIDALKHQQKQLDLEGRYKAFDRSRTAAKEQADSLEGRDISELLKTAFVQPGQQTPPNAVTAMNEAGLPALATQERKQVQIPGSEEFGVEGFSVQPRSMQELLQAQARAKFSEPYTLNRGAKRMIGDEVIAEGEPFPEPQPPREPAQPQKALPILLLEAEEAGDTQRANMIRGVMRANQNPPAPQQERLVQIMGPNGTPIWVKESEAVGKPAAQAARAVTGQERTALSYYNRAFQATKDIETPGADGVSLEDKVAKASLGQQFRLQYAPNVAQSPENQAYRQAQRAFTEARLRKESGAAIPAGEYENDARTYFAQPGDDPATIDQKRKARAVVLDGLKFGAGKAFDEYYGAQAPQGQGGSEFNWVDGKLVPVTR